MASGWGNYFHQKGGGGGGGRDYSGDGYYSRKYMHNQKDFFFPIY